MADALGRPLRIVLIPGETHASKAAGVLLEGVVGGSVIADKAYPSMRYPVTPDGRYFVVRGRLWRTSRPDLTEEARARLVSDLMTARREVGRAGRAGDAAAEAQARAAVDDAKWALGERGPVWWSDGAPDLNRRMARTTPYADWFAALPVSE